MVADGDAGDGGAGGAGDAVGAGCSVGVVA